MVCRHFVYGWNGVRRNVDAEADDDGDGDGDTKPRIMLESMVLQSFSLNLVLVLCCISFENLKFRTQIPALVFI